MIDAVIIAKIFTTYFGMWAVGYGLGKSVAWTRKITSVS